MPNISYDGQDKWKQKATDLLNQGGGGGGTDNYEELNNLPQINSTTLIGDLSLNDLFYDWYNIGSDYFVLADGDPSQATDQNPVYEVGFTSDDKAKLVFFKDLSGGYGEFEYLDFERLHDLLQLSNNYNDLINQPYVNGYLMQGNVTLPYASFNDKPSINGVTLSGALSLSDLSIPETYNDLNNKPSINNVTLSGNKTLADLGIVEFADTYSITSASFTLYSGDLDDATAQSPIYSIGFDATSDASLIFSKYEDPTSGSSVWLTMDDVVKLRRWYEYCENGWDIYPEMWSGAQPTDAETDILLEAPIDETDATQGVHQMRYSTEGIKYSTRIGGAITNVFSIGRSEIQALENVTGNIQTQINGKQSTITGAATTIVSSNLTDSLALVSDSNGKVAVSNVTSAELEYLSGVSSNIQTQLDGKSNTNHTHNSIKDIGNSTNTTFAYSKAGLGLSDFTWLACWNGYELRAVNKSNFITTANIGSQTVSKAGTCTGNAATASDASKLNGYASDTAASKNTIARRDGNGYLRAVYYNQSSGAENIGSYSGALIAFFSTDGWLRKTSIANAGVALRKSVLTWTYLMDKNANGTYTVSSMANFEDICICFGYVNQTQETINIPRSRFASGAGIVIKDSVNSQHCEVYYVSATQIKLANLSHSSWHVVVYGR